MALVNGSSEQKILGNPAVTMADNKSIINQYKASGLLVYSLVNTIVKIMAQLQILYSEWLDQDLDKKVWQTYTST